MDSIGERVETLGVAVKENAEAFPVALALERTHQAPVIEAILLSHKNASSRGIPQATDEKPPGSAWTDIFYSGLWNPAARCVL
jgi:hypothetical protein